MVVIEQNKRCAIAITHELSGMHTKMKNTPIFVQFADQTTTARSGTGAPTMPAADTMYTNMANLQQTMLLQQRLFLQALCQNSQMTSPSATGNSANVTTAKDDANKKHFTAPSLSQYRFVSGQQVRFVQHIQIDPHISCSCYQ